MSLRYTLPEETATDRPLYLSDLPADISAPAVRLPSAEFGIAKRNPNGNGYTVIAVMTLTMETLRNWERTIGANVNAADYRFFMAPDCT